jgi:putative ABC transport system permease protein
VDKTKFQKFRNYDLREGNMDEFMSARDAAIVGASIAKRKGWKSGQTIDLRDQLGILLDVKGIFLSGNEDQDNTIIADIEYVQDQYDARGQANIFMVKLTKDARADDVVADIDAMPFPTGTNSQAEKAFISGMIEDLGDMISLSRLVILITLLVVFLSVANTVSMSVRDRTRQIGMMRTLGFKRWMVLSMVVSEAALICFTGGVIGIVGAWAVLQFQDVTVQARAMNLVVKMPMEVVGIALLLSIGIGLIGSMWPGFRASRMKIVEAIGSPD